MVAKKMFVPETGADIFFLEKRKPAEAKKGSFEFWSYYLIRNKGRKFD